MDIIFDMIPIILFLATPLIISGLGGLYSERSGVVNIAIEGCMVMGAFVGTTVMIFASEAGMGPTSAWIGIVASIITGGLFVSIHAFAAIHMRADQTISGTALNVLAGGLSIYMCEIIFGSKSTPSFSISSTIPKWDVPLLSEIPFIGDILFSGHYVTTYMTVVLVVLTWFVLYKTPFGLRLRSCGENPQASASMGVNVVKMRWIAVLTSGALAGLGGAVLVFTTSTLFNNLSIHGLGFVALATLIFGRWNPWGVLGAGIFFGFAQTVGIFSSSIPFLASLPSELFTMFPYVATILVLIIFNNKGAAPKASGEIYDASKR